MGSKLSHTLLDLGFFLALGTSEHPATTKEEIHVGHGTPNTFDSNNGVMVVYDEMGRPWILRNNHVPDEFVRKVQEYCLKRGAYVPHSNDGGHFICKVLPKL